MEYTEVQDYAIKRRIRRRDVVGIIALLTLYYQVILKKSFNANGIADHPAVVNIPVIVGFHGNTRVQFERWAERLMQTYDRERLRYINSIHAQLTRFENDTRVTQAAIIDGGNIQQNLKRLDVIHYAKIETMDRLHRKTVEVMCDIISWLHVVNTRTPRTIHADNVVDFLMYVEELLQLMSINEDKATLHEYIDGFLLSTFLAGVEGGVPVVPIDDELYMNTIFHHDIFVASMEIQFPTTDQHRGEAAWTTNHTSLNLMFRVEHARRTRATTRALQEMLDNLNLGMPLSDSHLNQLQHITNALRPLALPARMLQESSNESEPHLLPEASNESEPYPLSMQLLGQDRFRGMTLEEVRACLARDRAAERR